MRGDAVPSSYERGRDPDFDGVAEVWVDGLVALPWLRPDLLDETASLVLVTQEVVVKDGPVLPAARGGVKLVQLIHRRAGLGVDGFRRYWRDVHGPLAAANEHVRRYVQHHVRHDLHGAPGPRHDGSPMTWFDGIDALRASGRSEVVRRVREDEAAFLADPGGHLPHVVVAEHEVATRR